VFPWLRRWSAAWRHSHLDADLREEIETHRALRQAQLEREGRDPRAADRASRRALGNVTLAREDVRGLSIAPWLDSLWQDVRFSARAFARRPLVWSVAVLSLALGIGMNTAAFSVFHQVLLRHLPVPAPDELVLVLSPGPKPGSRSTTNDGGMDAIFSYPLVRDLERLDWPAVAGLAAHGSFGANLAAAGQMATQGDGLLVSGGYFPVLGIRPALGRLLGPDDDRVPGAHPVVVLSHRYWTDRLGARPDVIDATLVVNGRALTIVGVTPGGFTGTRTTGGPDIFVPLAMVEAVRPGWRGTNARSDHWLYLVARLRTGVTREQAERQMDVPFAALLRDVEFPVLRSQMGDVLHAAFLARRIVLDEGARGRSAERQEARTVLLLLMAVTGFVLLIACANVANLLLTRAADRTAEMALRLSLGAGRGRLIRGLLTEACLLGLAGAVTAVGIARLTLNALVALAPSEGGRPFEVALSTPVWLFALALGLGTGLLFGLFPAVQGVRMATAQGLRAQSARASGSRAVVRFRATLATLQTALATALLALAGFSLVSLANLARVELGLERDGLIMFGISPYLSGYSANRTTALVDELEETLRGLPGVRAVSTTTIPLLTGWDSAQNLTVEGFEASPGTNMHANRAAVGTDYFRTLGIPLLAGRELSRADTEGSPRVAIVNEAFARKFNLGREVVGKRFALGQGSNTRPDIEIVGLARDAAYSSVRQAPPPQFFLPHRQAERGAPTFFFYVRAVSDARPLVDAIRPLVNRLAPNLPVINLRTMEDQIAQGMTGDRLAALFTAAFAALATLLAGVGLYAVLAYGVARRSREIGIRIALGATRGTIRRSVLGQVGRITTAGVLLGSGAALGLARGGESFLFGLEGARAGVLAAAVAAVVVVTVAAAILPVRRAVSVNPVEALRAE
jgi:predicted permease